MKRKTNEELDLGIVVPVACDAATLRTVEKVCEEASRRLFDVARCKQNLDVAHAQGFFAEHWHTETFSIDAALKKAGGLHARVCEDLRHYRNSPDAAIQIEGQGPSELYQLKYYKTAKESIDAQKGYGTQRRLIPTDQIEDGKDYVNKKISSDLATEKENRINNAGQLQEVKERLTDRIEKDGVHSEPLTRKGSDAKLKEAQRGELKLEPQIDVDTVMRESLKSGAVAFGITFASAAAPIVLDGLREMSTTGHLPRGFFHDIASKAAPAASVAAVRASVASALTFAARGGILGEALKGASPELIGSLTFLAIEGIQDYYAYSHGKIDGETFADGMMLKGAASIGGTYGAIVGQTLIPVPLVGAMLGAMVGSILAKHGYSTLDAISDLYFHAAEFEEMQKLSGQIAVSYSDFANSYEVWIRKNRYYAIMLASIESDIEKIDAQDVLVTRKLMGR